MFNKYYNDDPDDNTEHYRVYRRPWDKELVVACLQNFDYVDYDEDGFEDDEFFLYKTDADHHLLRLKNPDLYLPADYESHYRLYEVDGMPKVVYIRDFYAYEDFDKTKFVNDTYYETEAEAIDAAWSEAHFMRTPDTAADWTP